jgi:hypothetical protein
MIDADSVAQRHPENEGRALVDYLPVLLPCQLLLVDALLVDRRPLPTPIEFFLKAIKGGLTTTEQIGGFLGFTETYAAKLSDQLKNEEFIIEDISGHLSILRRGKEALDQDGDRIVIDRTITVLWDPVTETPIFGRPELLDYKKVSGLLRVRFPGAQAGPTIEKLGVNSIQSYRRFVNDIDAAADREDILRLVAVRRAIHRYRFALLLLYENGKAPPIAKFAIENHIDEKLSSAFAQKNGISYLGIDAGFSRKAGVLAVEDRFKKLHIHAAQGTSIGAASQRKGVLRVNIAHLNLRFAEEPSENIRRQLEKRVAELESIEACLKNVPVRKLGAAEMPICLSDALVKAKTSVVVTTTNPSEDRFTEAVAETLERALERGVKVSIFIADRFEADSHTKVSGRPAVARLNDLGSRYGNLRIDFLVHFPRPVYEVTCDGVELAFANDPCLGQRHETQPRSFRGYHVYGMKVVSEYVGKHLTFGDADVLKRTPFRPLRPKTRHVSNRRQVRAR